VVFGNGMVRTYNATKNTDLKYVRQKRSRVYKPGTPAENLIVAVGTWDRIAA
jgi:hypothetical protein